MLIQKMRLSLAPLLLLGTLALPAAHAQTAAAPARAEIPTAVSRQADAGEPLQPITRDYSLFWFVVPIVVILSLGITRRSRTRDVRLGERPNAGVWNSRAYPAEDAPDTSRANPGRPGPETTTVQRPSDSRRTA